MPAKRALPDLFAPEVSKESLIQVVSPFSASSLAVGKAARNMVVTEIAPVSSLRRIKA